MNKSISKECKCLCHHSAIQQLSDGTTVRTSMCSCHVSGGIVSCPHCQSQPLNEDTEDWKVRFIKELCNDHNKDEGLRLLRGIFVEDIMEFIAKELADQKQRILQSEVMKDEFMIGVMRDKDGNYVDSIENIVDNRLKIRNELREEIRKVIKEA